MKKSLLSFLAAGCFILPMAYVIMSGAVAMFTRSTSGHVAKQKTPYDDEAAKLYLARLGTERPEYPPGNWTHLRTSTIDELEEYNRDVLAAITELREKLGPKAALDLPAWLTAEEKTDSPSPVGKAITAFIGTHPELGGAIEKMTEMERSDIGQILMRISNGMMTIRLRLDILEAIRNAQDDEAAKRAVAAYWRNRNIRSLANDYGCKIAIPDITTALRIRQRLKDGLATLKGEYTAEAYGKLIRAYVFSCADAIACPELRADIEKADDETAGKLFLRVEEIMKNCLDAAGIPNE